MPDLSTNAKPIPISPLLQRLAREDGFTIIELRVVIGIIGALIAVTVPSYLGFNDRASDKAAQSNVRAAFPVAEAYVSDVGNSTNMALTTGDPPDSTGLKGIDAGIKLDKVTGGASTYSLCAISGNYVAVGTGPNHTITSTKVTAHTPTAADC